MVSGFFTSPNDHERIRSGEASAILIASKSSVWRCWLKRLSRSFMVFSGRRNTLSMGCQRTNRRRCCITAAAPARSVVFQFHVDGQRTDFLHQHVEGFRHAGNHLVLAVDDVLVHLVAALYVIGL